MKLGELLRGLDHIPSDPTVLDTEITGISISHEGDLSGRAYVCIKGRRCDGHEYIGQALQNGAAVIVTENDAPAGIRSVRVRSCRRAWAFMESAAAGDPQERLHMVAVTGTNGKSSVVRFLRSIIEAGGEKCGEIGTLTCAMTTPDPDVLYPALARMAGEGCGYVAMEASSHALALDKLAPVRFDCAVFTNLTLDHTDFHGSMAAYGAAKAKLFSMCGAALVNRGDAAMRALSERAPCTRYFYGTGRRGADYTARGLTFTPDGFSYDLYEKGKGVCKINSPLCGDFHAENSLAAAGAARILGFPPDAVRDGIASVRRISGRLEPATPAGAPFRAFIDYAHTPDAIRKACASVRRCMTPEERLTLIFGCGGDRDRTKRPLMGAAAEECADYVVVTADNSRGEDVYDIMREIVSGISDRRKHVCIADRRQAIRYAVHSAREGDVLLFCGKGHEKYEITAGGASFFDEASEIARAFAEINKE